MTKSYVIRGGEEGRARLSVLAGALAPTTAALFGSVGLRAGMRCLDVGCGGGDVTLAIARVVGTGGSVVGIDVDPVKIALAVQDASDEGAGCVEYRCGDATTLDARDEYDLVYARFLLTHMADPQAMLRSMVDAVVPGGVVVVEDIDHSGVFSYPRCPVLDRFIALYDDAARRRGGDPVIGPKLVGMMRDAGLTELRLGVVQPVYTDGPVKRFHEITLANVRDAILDDGGATAGELDAIAEELHAFADDPGTLVAFPRIFQVAGRRHA